MDWEAEKEKLTQKFQEEIKGYQAKINQLLVQLRKEQQRNKEENANIRSLMNRSFARDDEVNTSIYYTKEVVDDLKREINHLQTKLNTMSTEGNENSLDEKMVQYAILEKKYQESLKRIEQLEKNEHQVLGSFRPDYDPQIVNYEKEIDTLREKIRDYENREIPQLQEQIAILEKKLKEAERKKGIADTVESERAFLESRVKELEDTERENKNKLVEAARIIHGLRKETEAKIQKIKEIAIAKINQVRESIQLVRAELQHIAQNTSFFSQLIFNGFDKVKKE